MIFLTRNLPMRLPALAITTISMAISSHASAEAPGGPRVEALAGWNSISTDQTSSDANGATFGLRLGYDQPLGSDLSIGIDAEGSKITGKQTSRILVPVPSIPSGPFGPPTTGTQTFNAYDVHTRMGRNLYLGGRISLSLSSRIGLFATVGYANQRLKSCGERAGSDLCSGSGPVSPIPPFLPLNIRHSVNVDGVRFGGGAMLTLSRGLFANVEYRHAEYSNNVSGNQIVSGLGWRF